MKTHVATPVLFALLLMFSCTKDSLELAKIESDIVIRMWEKLEPNKRSLILYCSTIDYYPLGNYSIAYSLDMNQKNINIGFYGIHVPSGGQTSVEPAKAMIDLGSLSKGVYTLRVHVGGITSIGQIAVSEKCYRIDFDTHNMLQIDNSRLNRVPDQTIWGYVNYITQDMDNVAHDFLDSLQALGAQPGTWLPGDYGYFTITPDGQIAPPLMLGTPFSKPFIFHYPGDKNNLVLFMKKFATPHFPYLRIIFYSSCGIAQGSW